MGSSPGTVSSSPGAAREEVKTSLEIACDMASVASARVVAEHLLADSLVLLDSEHDSHAVIVDQALLA